MREIFKNYLKKNIFMVERLKHLGDNIEFVVTHHVNFLCPLKCPGEGDSAVALNQV